ncbi:MAG: tyrosine-type recombinase/integrase [Pseudonocardiaceae bacterium]
MGWVEELPSGRWRGVARNAITGKRWSKAHHRWADADAWWRAEERDTDGSYTTAGIDITRQQRGVPSFAEHVVEWARRGIADPELSTLRGYRGQARQLAKRWPMGRVDEITERMVRDYFADLRDAGYSPSTRTLRLTVLRHAMRDAIAAGYRPDDPTLRIKGPKRREHQARLLSEQELMMMLACLPGWLWPAVLLSHDAGLRVCEVVGLRMANLDLLHGTVTIADIIDVDGELRTYPKSKLVRHVPLSARCLTALRDHVATYNPAGRLGHVFANPADRKRHLRPARVRAEWDRALELAQLDGEKPTWHDLRHGCATTLADSGADPWVIQAILGHGSIATSQRYVRKANLGRQSAAVSRAFGDPVSRGADAV